MFIRIAEVTLLADLAAEARRIYAERAAPRLAGFADLIRHAFAGAPRSRSYRKD
jgi:hypothetical protein